MGDLCSLHSLGDVDDICQVSDALWRPVSRALEPSIKLDKFAFLV